MLNYPNRFKEPAEAPMDCSNPYESVYTEIPPFAFDEKGNCINKSGVAILKPNGKINIDEQIQSYRDECDIYKLLATYEFTGDNSVLQQRPGVFLDVNNLPDNINDFSAYFDNMAKNLSGYPIEMQQAVVNGASPEAYTPIIDKLVKNYLVKNNLIKSNTTKEIDKNE